MARYTDGRCRLCRRENTKLFLKGVRCSTPKCALAKRQTPPGMHTRVSGKPSYYSLQLREKQKVKRMYGMLERQFRKFFDDATKSKGVTGKTLMQMLERRLDNVAFRCLFLFSRAQARQFVRHGFLFVNNRRVDIPSYLIKAGDVLEVKAHDKFRQIIKANVEASAKDRSVPSWLELDKENLKVKVLRLPEREDLVLAVNEQLIVELYSK